MCVGGFLYSVLSKRYAKKGGREWVPSGPSSKLLTRGQRKVESDLGGGQSCVLNVNRIQNRRIQKENPKSECLTVTQLSALAS